MILKLCPPAARGGWNVHFYSICSLRHPYKTNGILPKLWNASLGCIGFMINNTLRIKNAHWVHDGVSLIPPLSNLMDQIKSGIKFWWIKYFDGSNIKFDDQIWSKLISKIDIWWSNLIIKLMIKSEIWYQIRSISNFDPKLIYQTSNLILIKIWCININLW